MREWMCFHIKPGGTAGVLIYNLELRLLSLQLSLCGTGVFYIIKERIYDVKDILRIVCKGIISGQVKVPQKFRGI